MAFPQLDLKSEKGPKAVIKTNRGDITVQLFPELAPKTVQNFIELSKKGYYDGVIFQEWVAKVFMAKVLKMNSVVNCSTFAELYLWQIQVQTQTEANSLL